MDKVLRQAELLAEAILESREYIRMRICEEAVLNGEGRENDVLPRDMREAQNDFYKMMAEVSAVVKRIVDGETPDMVGNVGCGGCAGGCR